MCLSIATALWFGWVETLLVAHQGGWDEILLVAIPLGLMAWLLWLANRRASGSVGRQGGSDEMERP